ncbi:MAG: hypothetical protein ACO1OX_05285 [Novosphingobium sp.]
MADEDAIVRLKAELGSMRVEAIGHFLSDGDFLGFNQEDFEGAIAEYEKAWNQLSTPWQQQNAGVPILSGIADFALHSGDPDLASRVLGGIMARSGLVDVQPLRDACAKLQILAGKH